MKSENNAQTLHKHRKDNCWHFHLAAARADFAASYCQCPPQTVPETPQTRSDHPKAQQRSERDERRRANMMDEPADIPTSTDRRLIESADLPAGPPGAEADHQQADLGTDKKKPTHTHTNTNNIASHLRSLSAGAQTRRTGATTTTTTSSVTCARHGRHGRRHRHRQQQSQRQPHERVA